MHFVNEAFVSPHSRLWRHLRTHHEGLRFAAHPRYDMYRPIRGLEELPYLFETSSRWDSTLLLACIFNLKWPPLGTKMYRKINGGYEILRLTVSRFINPQGSRVILRETSPLLMI